MGVERVLATIPAVDGEVHDALMHIEVSSWSISVRQLTQKLSN